MQYLTFDSVHPHIVSQNGALNLLWCNPSLAHYMIYGILNESEILSPVTPLVVPVKLIANHSPRKA